ncbi:hypothetical protein ACIRVK_35975 [Streptomyces sp. NPDC101152]|uniref:hypothetical protein n=1 Tax=Streptomyces sp. NPDC101152 TaxID=3366116 RepID=UPI00381824BD
MNTDEPNWLDDEEQQTWLAMVGMLISLPAALDAQLRATPASPATSTRSSPDSPCPPSAPCR